MGDILERKGVLLVANKPQSIEVKDGMDLRTTEIELKYNILSKNICIINIRYYNNNGDTVSNKVRLPTSGYICFLLSPPDSPMISRVLYNLELTSPIDLNLDVIIRKMTTSFLKM